MEQFCYFVFLSSSLILVATKKGQNPKGKWNNIIFLCSIACKLIYAQCALSLLVIITVYIQQSEVC